ncbi:MAG: UvrB/UvrC motif-containing protein, partial [Rhodocyclaceae bacterium]|nr:UvrB/UvrC motif-containing protein [Rhodocyclaceae bacterium]
DSMRAAIGETERRREKQIAHNLANGIVPRTVSKRIKDIIDGVYDEAQDETAGARGGGKAAVDYTAMDEKSLAKAIKKLEKEMQEFARNLEFEKAAAARDELFRLRRTAFGADQHGDA